ncbi:hypothetical protein G6F40_016687 [Rhizopus arrhizus]|nr:hypothetical protein G6F40_016687 [Rhizopus arrhizus]
MGWDACVLQEGVRAALTNDVTAAHTPAIPALSDAGLAAALAQGAQAVDLRPGMRYRASHITGAAWSIRPRLDRLDLDSTRPVILLAEEAAVAAWAAEDLRAQGVTDIQRVHRLPLLRA